MEVKVLLKSEVADKKSCFISIEEYDELTKKTVDLFDYRDKEEFLEEFKEEFGEDAEPYISDFPDEYRWWIDDGEVDEYLWDYMWFVGIEDDREEAVQAALSMRIIDNHSNLGDYRHLMELYEGYYETDYDFGYHIMTTYNEDLFQMLSERDMVNCYNYEALAEKESYYFDQLDGHYFRQY